MRILMVVFLVACSGLLFSQQLDEIKYFPYKPCLSSYSSVQTLYKDNFYYVFFFDSSGTNFQAKVSLVVSKSKDLINWSAPERISPQTDYNEYLSVTGCIHQNEFVLFYRDTENKGKLIKSDNATIWSDINIDFEINHKKHVLCSAGDSLYLIMSDSPFIYFTKTAGDLSSWTPVKKNEMSMVEDIAAYSPERGKVVILRTRSFSPKSILLSYILSDTLKNVGLSIDFNNYKLENPKAIVANDSTVWVVFSYSHEVQPGYFAYDVAYTKSTDDYFRFGDPVSLTSYKGFDYASSICTDGIKPFVTMFSDRTSKSQAVRTPGTVYGFLGESVDKENYPVIRKVNYSGGNVLKVNAFIQDTMPGDLVYVYFKKNYRTIDSLTLFNDGIHNDSLAGDAYWGNEFALNPGDLINFSVKVKRGNAIICSNEYTVSKEIIGTGNAYNLDVNNIKFPFNNVGFIADPDTSVMGTLNSFPLIYAGGFCISGFQNGKLWAGGNYFSKRFYDFVPGKTSSDQLDPKNILYVVKRSDPDFSFSWQLWKYAVENGADFYDGNLDGKYEPADLNNNGKWDENEDKPYLIGDVTTWSVFHDAYLRSNIFSEQPVGVEISQTTFAAGNSSDADNIVFVRYKISNKGYSPEDFDSVYFSFLTDGDIGYPYDDLTGCDVNLQGAFTYNSTNIDSSGVNPPALFVQLLEGPKVYLPGISFIDKNNNNIFDNNDIPLDTAFVNPGPGYPVKIFPGAVNQKIHSYLNWHNADNDQPIFGTVLRNFQMGLSWIGTTIDPCTFGLSEIFSVKCDTIIPYLFYSGDPVNKTGWINTIPNDQQMVLSTGPFSIKHGDNVEILCAYIAGRGTSNLNSITVARDIARYAKQTAEENFINYPPANGHSPLPSSDYHLYQNYPNPFNPSTRIRYNVQGTLGSLHSVSMKLYDILGREVAVLINEIKPSGVYELDFNASEYKLASGVYIYRLKSDNSVDIKKMMLIK